MELLAHYIVVMVQVYLLLKFHVQHFLNFNLIVSVISFPKSHVLDPHPYFRQLTQIFLIQVALLYPSIYLFLRDV